MLLGWLPILSLSGKAQVGTDLGTPKKVVLVERRRYARHLIPLALQADNRFQRPRFAANVGGAGKIGLLRIAIGDRETH